MFVHILCAIIGWIGMIRHEKNMESVIAHKFHAAKYHQSFPPKFTMKMNEPFMLV